MTKPFPFHGCSEELKHHLQRVIDGEYDIAKIDFTHPPTILDIGANVGSYSYWALNRFPQSYIFAYEPDVDNVKSYIKNMTEVFGVSPQWRVIQGAVTTAGIDGRVNLYKSTINSGMHSTDKELTNTPLAEVVSVQAFHPHRLPQCNILKIDAEGVEPEVIKAYCHSHILPDVICFEFHSRFDYYELDRFLSDNYTPHSGQILHADIGTLCYLHNAHII